MEMMREIDRPTKMGRLHSRLISSLYLLLLVFLQGCGAEPASDFRGVEPQSLSEKSSSQSQSESAPSIQGEESQEPVVQEPVVQEPVVQEPELQEPELQEPVLQEESTPLALVTQLGEKARVGRIQLAALDGSRLALVWPGMDSDHYVQVLDLEAHSLMEKASRLVGMGEGLSLSPTLQGDLLILGMREDKVMTYARGSVADQRYVAPLAIYDKATPLVKYWAFEQEGQVFRLEQREEQLILFVQRNPEQQSDFLDDELSWSSSRPAFTKVLNGRDTLFTQPGRSMKVWNIDAEARNIEVTNKIDTPDDLAFDALLQMRGKLYLGHHGEGKVELLEIDAWQQQGWDPEVHFEDEFAAPARSIALDASTVSLLGHQAELLVAYRPEKAEAQHELWLNRYRFTAAEQGDKLKLVSHTLLANQMLEAELECTVIHEYLVCGAFEQKEEMAQPVVLLYPLEEGAPPLNDMKKVAIESKERLFPLESQVDEARLPSSIECGSGSWMIFRDAVLRHCASECESCAAEDYSCLVSCQYNSVLCNQISARVSEKCGIGSWEDSHEHPYASAGDQKTWTYDFDGVEVQFELKERWEVVSMNFNEVRCGTLYWQDLAKALVRYCEAEGKALYGDNCKPLAKNFGLCYGSGENCVNKCSAEIAPIKSEILARGESFKYNYAKELDLEFQHTEEGWKVISSDWDIVDCGLPSFQPVEQALIDYCSVKRQTWQSRKKAAVAADPDMENYFPTDFCQVYKDGECPMEDPFPAWWLEERTIYFVLQEGDFYQVWLEKNKHGKLEVVGEGMWEDKE